MTIKDIMQRRGRHPTAVVWVDATHWLHEFPTVGREKVLAVFDVQFDPANGGYPCRFLRYEDVSGQVIELDAEFYPFVPTMLGCIVVEKYNNT